MKTLARILPLAVFSIFNLLFINSCDFIYSLNGTEYTFGKTWPLKDTTVFRQEAPVVGLYGDAHSLISTSLYVSGNSALDSNGNYYPGVWQYNLDGTLKANIKPGELAAAAGLAVTSKYATWVWTDEEKDRLYILNNDFNWDYTTNELYCLKMSDNSLLWKRNLGNPDTGEYGDLYVYATPEIWGNYLILQDTRKIKTSEEKSAMVMLIDRDSLNGAAAITRYYPGGSTTIYHGNIRNNELFIMTTTISMLRLNLIKLVDPAYTDADCIEYQEDRGPNGFGFNTNTVFTDNLYIYGDGCTVKARSLADNSLVWSYYTEYWSASANYMSVTQPRGVNLIYQDLFFMPTWDGLLYCFKASTGKLLWQTYLTVENQSFDPIVTGENMDSNGIVINDQWYATTNGTQNALFLVDIDTGEKELCYDIERNCFCSHENLFLQDGVIYAVSRGGVYALTVAERKDISCLKKLPARLARKWGWATRNIFKPKAEKVNLAKKPFTLTNARTSMIE
jgi:outer membrane protein assembly factor BamB